MDIYTARILQKKLFKSLEVNVKRNRTYVYNGQLFYQILYRVSYNNDLTFRYNSPLLNRMKQLLPLGLIITFQYTQGDEGYPKGMYAFEAIPID